MKIEVKGVSFAYGSREVLREISVEFGRRLNIVVGPNAAGKSTFLRCLANLEKYRGMISVSGRDMRSMPREELSGILSYMPQEPYCRGFLTVFETVLLGRLGSLALKVNDEDLEIAHNALRSLAIEDLAGFHFGELSVGQRQMVTIAQAVAREPRCLIMDEPTSNLDLRHQFELYSLIKGIIRERDIAAVIALHDLNFAARYADFIIVLSGGRLYSCGAPAEVLTADMLREVYGVRAMVKPDKDGVPVINPVGII